MYSHEVRLHAGAYLNDWVRYIRDGGDMERLKSELDSLGEDPRGPSDVLDYMARDLVGTAKYHVDEQLPQGCSLELVDSFVAVTSVVARELAGIDEGDMRRLVAHLRDEPGAQLSHVIDPVGAYFALQALLAPTDDEGLWGDRRVFSRAYDLYLGNH